MQCSHIEIAPTTKVHMKEEDCLKELIHQCDVICQKHLTLESDLD
jgi:hypothetical protein